MKFVNKLQKFLNLFFFSKKIFTKPEKSEILIFDSDHSKIILSYFPKQKVHILDVRYKQQKGQKINFFIIFKLLFFFKLSSYNYFKEYIRYVSPKIIISLIDNNEIFFKVKKMFPQAKTILIQNAWRTAECTDLFGKLDLLKKKNYRCDYILPFNSGIGKQYKSFLNGKVLPIGSFISNYNIKKNLKKKYENLFISIYRPWRKLPDSYYELLKTINTFFSNKVNGKLYVLGAMIANSKEEKNFYNKFLKNTKYIFLPRFIGRPTYDIVDQSKIILGTESTLAYEALARGNKVAYFSLRKSSYPESTAKFGWPINKRDYGPFWINSAQIKPFVRLLDYLNNLKCKDYYKILNKHSCDLIKFDEGNKKFKKLINKLI